MFENLIESSGKRKRSLGQSFVSLVIHGAVIFGAIKATQGVAEEIADRPIDTTMVFLKPPEATPPPPEPPPENVVVSANPPPKGFQTVIPPDIIPKDIPPVDLNQKPFDPKDFTGKGVEGGIAAGVVGGTGPVDLNSEVFLSTELDDPASVETAFQPRFPPALQAAGIEGFCEVMFIVGTDGHAESNSIKMLNCTNKQFEEPTREAVMKTVFRPARNRGEKVRQQVQQRIRFTITR